MHIYIRIIAASAAGAAEAQQRALTVFQLVSEIVLIGASFGFVIGDDSMRKLEARSRAQTEFVEWLLLQKHLYSENCIAADPNQDETTANLG